MHPLLKLLLCNFFVICAQGQQPHYSINGEGTSAQYRSNSNLAPSPMSYMTTNNYQTNNNHHLTSSYYPPSSSSSSYSSPSSSSPSNPGTYHSPPQLLPYSASSQSPAPSQQSINYGTYSHDIQTSTSQNLRAYAQPPLNLHPIGVSPYGGPQPDGFSVSQQPQMHHLQPTQHTNYPSSPPMMNMAQAASAPPGISPQQNAQFSHRQLSFMGGSQPPPNARFPAHSTNNPAYNTAPTMTSVNSFGQPISGGPPGGAVSSQQFMNRRGPLDSMISRAKEWMPSLKKSRGKHGSGGSYSAGMGDMSRLPKPPKYPLYDMGDMGMATPPPPPLMSPMAQMPTNLFNTFAAPPSGTSGPSGSSHPRGGRPSPPPPPSSLPPRRGKGKGNKRRRNRPAPPHPSIATSPKYRDNKRQRPRPRNPPPKSQRNTYTNKIPANDGFDHPMASNVAPVNSPPLGRPLGYDEYMKRPTHSFTDDPWNFDPNAQNYNEGMNTHAMKYNYDPLGTNTLDTSVQSHLDINKMSYPGDSMHMDPAMKDSPKPISSQLGGWDTYSRQPGNSNSNHQQSSHSNNNHNKYSQPNSNSFNNRYQPQHDDQRHDGGAHIAFDDMMPSTTMRNSFSHYDPTTEASIVKSETLSPITLISSGDGAIEFDIDSTLKGSASNNYDEYKLSDHYSPVGESHLAAQHHPNNYDQYSSSQHTNHYNSYLSNPEYGSRHTRDNTRISPHLHRSGKKDSPHSSMKEAMGVFHDFIGDPNPGLGKARARHSLYAALMS